MHRIVVVEADYPPRLYDISTKNQIITIDNKLVSVRLVENKITLTVSNTRIVTDNDYVQRTYSEQVAHEVAEAKRLEESCTSQAEDMLSRTSPQRPDILARLTADAAAFRGRVEQLQLFTSKHTRKVTTLTTETASKHILDDDAVYIIGRWRIHCIKQDTIEPVDLDLPTNHTCTNTITKEVKLMRIYPPSQLLESVEWILKTRTHRLDSEN